MPAKRFVFKAGNNVDGCAAKRDSQLKPFAAFDLICVIYLLPDFPRTIMLNKTHPEANRYGYGCDKLKMNQ
jgi:hypothetical protein